MFSLDYSVTYPTGSPAYVQKVLNDKTLLILMMMSLNLDLFVTVKYVTPQEKPSPWILFIHSEILFVVNVCVITGEHKSNVVNCLCFPSENYLIYRNELIEHEFSHGKIFTLFSINMLQRIINNHN